MNQLTTSRPNAALVSYIGARLAEFDLIPDKRKKDLAAIAEYAQQAQRETGVARLMFICTHNSRRSHLSQIWAQTAAAWFGVPGVETSSGGTESTAFNPRAIAAVERAGFLVEKASDEPNPVVIVRWNERSKAMVCFSKAHDQAPNPTKGFGAVMTCDSADAACPVVPGADERFSIPYVDPKIADGTPAEAARYDERGAQIARELLFAFSTLG